jgi:hypothetical protein
MRAWKGCRSKQAGLGDEPWQIVEALSEMALVDVALPTRSGTLVHEPAHRAAANPAQRLGLKLPTALERAAV